jgi:hypothetical protein
MREKLTRRRLLLGTGTVAAGTLGGIALGSQNAMATIDGDFTIPNAQTVLADTELGDIRLSVNAKWEYSANARMNTVEIELHVGGSPDTLDLIARHVKDDLGEQSLTGETELNGSLMSTSDFGVSDFNPDSGRVTQTVVAELRFYVLRDGEVAAEALQRTTFDITVSAEELSVEMTMNATGEVEFTTATSN